MNAYSYILLILMFLASSNLSLIVFSSFFPDTGIDYHALLKQFDHLNHMNPDKFESTDLDMLIKAVRIILKK